MNIVKQQPMIADETTLHEGYINPFLQDAYHMGTRIGRNVIALHSKFTEEDQPYIILINTKTGERIKIEMDDFEVETQN